MKPNKQVCAKRVRISFGFRSEHKPCGKPVKGLLKDGTPACGIHLAQEARYEAKDAQYAAEDATRKAQTARLAKVAKRLGITAGLQHNAFSSTQRYDHAIVSIDDLEKLAKELQR